MVFVKDPVGDSSSVDTAMDLDVGIAVWFGEIRRKTAIARNWERTLEEGCGNIITLEFELVTESSLDGGSKDSIHSEQEEMMVTCSSVSGLSVSRWRIGIHSADSSGHSLKGVIRKELQLEEEKEAEECCIGRDVMLVNECEYFIRYEHLGQLFVDSGKDCMLVIF